MKPYVYKPRNGACQRNRELVLKMESEGAFLNEIARAIGTTGIRVKEFLRRNGITREFPVALLGPRSSRWKGGRHIDKDGYVSILSHDHPHAKKYTHYVLEHRLVMEKIIGRYLKPNEVIHHRNGDKQDNRPENLQLFSENSEHLRHELTGKCPKWTPEGRANILKAIRRPRGKQPPRKRRRLSKPDGNLSP